MSTQEKISPDDPRLTAYALGELEPAERAEFEERLRQDPVARAWVAEIAGTVASIGAALAQEPLPETAAPDLSGKHGHGDRHLPGKEAKRHGLGKLIQFPYLYYTISGVAAACFAVAFVLWERTYRARPQVQYTVVDLTKLQPAVSADQGMSLPVAMASGQPSEGAQGFVAVKTSPVSSFLPTVGPAALDELKKALELGHRPAAGLVQIEALVNHFAYRYVQPGSAGRLFGTNLEVAAAPWSPAHRLVRIGLQGREVPAGGTTPLIARDLSVQVAFNPAAVLSYRLIGFEHRTDLPATPGENPLAASEIRSGHAVTALYEIVPNEQASRSEAAVAGRSVVASEKPVVALSDELLTVKLRYKLPEGELSQLVEFPLSDGGQSFEQASPDFKFAASVAAFGMILRDSPHKGSATLTNVADWAKAGTVEDTGGYRSDFLGLVRLAERLRAN